MFMTSWFYAIIAMGMAGLIYKYIEYRGLVYQTILNRLYVITTTPLYIADYYLNGFQS